MSAASGGRTRHGGTAHDYAAAATTAAAASAAIAAASSVAVPASAAAGDVAAMPHDAQRSPSLSSLWSRRAIALPAVTHTMRARAHSGLQAQIGRAHATQTLQSAQQRRGGAMDDGPAAASNAQRATHSNAPKPLAAFSASSAASGSNLAPPSASAAAAGSAASLPPSQQRNRRSMLGWFAMHAERCGMNGGGPSSALAAPASAAASSAAASLSQHARDSGFRISPPPPPPRSSLNDQDVASSAAQRFTVRISPVSVPATEQPAAQAQQWPTASALPQSQSPLSAAPAPAGSKLELSQLSQRGAAAAADGDDDGAQALKRFRSGSVALLRPLRASSPSSAAASAAAAYHSGFDDDDARHRSPPQSAALARFLPPLTSYSLSDLLLPAAPSPDSGSKAGNGIAAASPASSSRLAAASATQPAPASTSQLSASPSSFSAAAAAAAAASAPRPASPPAARLHFSSIYSAQVTSLSLQYNETPATAPTHACSSVRALPHEFARPVSTHHNSSGSSNNNGSANPQQPASRSYTRIFIPTTQKLLNRPAPQPFPTLASITPPFTTKTREASAATSAATGEARPALSPADGRSNGRIAGRKRKQSETASALPVAASPPAASSAAATKPSMVSQWTALAPAPFCFFPWTVASVVPTPVAAPAPAAALNVLTISALEDDSSDTSSSSDSDDMSDDSSIPHHRNGAGSSSSAAMQLDYDSQRTMMLAGSIAAAAPSTAAADVLPRLTPLSLHLRRLIQQQALAPLISFASASASSSSTAIASRSSRRALQLQRTHEQHGWLTVDSAATLAPQAHFEEEQLRRAKQLVARYKRDANSSASANSSMEPGELNDESMQLSSSSSSSTVIALGAAASGSSPAAPIDFALVSSNAPPSVSPSASSASALTLSCAPDPRIVLSFEDTPGHDELRSFVPGVMAWWERGGVRPFNPNLSGAWEKQGSCGGLAMPSLSRNVSMGGYGGYLGASSSAGGSGSSMQKHLLYLVLPPPQAALHSAHASLDTFFRNLSAMYEVAQLGRHVNLLAHTVRAASASSSARPRSCVLNLRYTRPSWLQEVVQLDLAFLSAFSDGPGGGGQGPMRSASPMQPSFSPFSEHLGPHPPRTGGRSSPPLLPSGSPPSAVGSTSGGTQQPAASPRAMSPSLLAMMAAAGLGDAPAASASAVAASLTSASESATIAAAAAAAAFPPLFHVLPPVHGMHRYYQSIVWGLLAQLCALVKAKEMAGSASGGGNLTAGGHSAASGGSSGGAQSSNGPSGSNSNTAGSGSSSASSSSHSRAPLDLERFDCLVLYICTPDDEEQSVASGSGLAGGLRHSLALLSHYLSYLTEPGKLLAEVEQRQEAQRARNKQLDAAAGSSVSSLLPDANGGTGELEYVFSESEKELWVTALQSIEHLHLIVRFVPASSLAPLSPQTLRAHALGVYTQSCRLSDRVSLFVPDASSLMGSLGLQPGALGSMELPPFHSWVEPLAVIERAQKLPRAWIASAAASEHSRKALAVAGTGPGSALHIAYSFESRHRCLLAVLMDERGVMLHSTIVVQDDTGGALSAAGQRRAASPQSFTPQRATPDSQAQSQTQHSPASLLHSLLTRLLVDHVRPLLGLLLRPMLQAHARLVFVQVGSCPGSTERQAWAHIALEQGWVGGGLEPTDSAGSGASTERSSALPATLISAIPGSAHVLDVTLLSCVPARDGGGAPHLARFSLAPPLAPRSSSPATIPAAAASSSMSDVSAGGEREDLPSRLSARDASELDAAIAAANQTLGSCLSSKSWWQSRTTPSASAASSAQQSASNSSPFAPSPSLATGSVGVGVGGGASGVAAAILEGSSVLDGFGLSATGLATKLSPFALRMPSSSSSSSSTAAPQVSQLFLVSRPAVLSAPGVSARSVLQRPSPPERPEHAACVSVEAYWSACDHGHGHTQTDTAAAAAASTSSGSKATCAACSAAKINAPSSAYLHSLLTAVLLQWKHLAVLNLPSHHAASNAARGGAAASAANPGEPVAHLPPHLTLLTRMHTILSTL